MSVKKERNFIRFVSGILESLFWHWKTMSNNLLYTWSRRISDKWDNHCKIKFTTYLKKHGKISKKYFQTSQSTHENPAAIITTFCFISALKNHVTRMPWEYEINIFGCLEKVNKFETKFNCD